MTSANQKLTDEQIELMAFSAILNLSDLQDKYRDDLIKLFLARERFWEITIRKLEQDLRDQLWQKDLSLKIITEDRNSLKEWYKSEIHKITNKFNQRIERLRSFLKNEAERRD